MLPEGFDENTLRCLERALAWIQSTHWNWSCCWIEIMVLN